MCSSYNQHTSVASFELTYVFKIARAVKMAFAYRTNIVLSEMFEIFFAFRVPDRAIAIITSLTYRSVFSGAVMAKQIVP